jgi:YVTN family beta-propeller protein
MSSAQPSADTVDGSRKERYAVPEDARYKSPIQLAISQDGRRLYVVCENTNEVLVVDPSEKKTVGTVRVGQHPFGITLSPDEHYLFVSNRWDNTVSVVDTKTMKVVRTFPVGDDPHGLVTDRSGAYLYVANLATDDISIIETEGFSEVKRLHAGTSPFAVALSADGKYLYVSNQLSNPVSFRTPPLLELTIIDTERQMVVTRKELFSTVIGQGTAVSPDNRFVVVALELPKNLIPETQIYQGWMVTYGLAIAEGRPDGRVAYLLLDEPNSYYADPYGVTFSPDGRYLYISSSGADIVSVLDMKSVRSVLEVQDGRIGISDETVRQYARHLGLSSEYVVARIPTKWNPKGLVVSSDGRWVYVANRLSDSITVIDAEQHKAVGTIDLGGPSVVTVLRKGERLFNHATISFQNQLSCNTCHPEHHLDGLTYDIAIDGGMGRNLVDNRSMRGIAETAPFKWSGKNPTLYRQEGPRAAQLFFRSHGFEDDEREAVVKFIESLSLPRNRYLTPDGLPNEFQKRGGVLYERAYTNDGRYIPVANRCITCHPAPFFTDRLKHDVGTQAYFDTQSDFDTPHLNSVYAKAPFLHDGRCYSLEEIWTKFNPWDLHGATNDMKKEQLNDLIEYTKALLPIVPPPLAQQHSAGFDIEFPNPGSGGADSSAGAHNRYVGNQVCKLCHAEAYRIWVGSKHARSYLVFQTGTAMTMMETSRLAAHDSSGPPTCFGCHAATALVPEEYRAKGFHIEEGVKCEVCHGPGEKHAMENRVKDNNAGEATRMMMPTEERCMACHKAKPSHEALKKKPFNYSEAWKKIAHSEVIGH